MQIISKCLFGVFNFLQKNERKQEDLRFYSSKVVEFVCLFFGGKVYLKIHFEFFWPLSRPEPKAYVQLRGSVSALNGLCADMNFPKSLDDVGTSIMLHNGFRTLLKSYLIISTSCGFTRWAPNVFSIVSITNWKISREIVRDPWYMTSDFFGYFWPTYPNQILYYISLCSKIRCNLTYLPT